MPARLSPSGEPAAQATANSIVLSGIALDSSGNIYVVDTGNNRVEKFSSTGTFIAKWGTSGTGDGQFSSPSGIALDSSGNVYVVDTGNNRVEKFDSSGTFVSKWGSYGSADGLFNSPKGIAYSSGIYVVDSGNNRVEQFTTTGTFVNKWGVVGSSDGQFNGPWGIIANTYGSDTYFYVADSSNNRIQKFQYRSSPITNYSYDALGNLVQVTDANNNMTTMTYDWLSRKTAMTDPDMGSWRR